MKKNRVNEILSIQTKRRKVIFGYLSSIIVLFCLALYLLFLFIDLNRTYYVSYKEQSNLDYKVYLKNNEFFVGEYLEKDQQYISTLIDYIIADFDYDLVMNEEVSHYEYSYKIVAEVNVKEDGGTNSLYTFEDVLSEEKTFFSEGEKNVNINEEITIDYNAYNDRIKKFVTTYDLEDIESTLSVNMYVNVAGSCADYEEESYNESVVSLTIPLTTNTVAIDMNYDLVDTNDNVMACKEDNEYSYLILVVSILGFGSAIGLTIAVIRYILSTRTAEDIYSSEIKKILNNYSSYIQKINNDFDMHGYQVLKVDTFNDMLEIRDTIQEPILMVENKTKDGTYFLIPSKTKILYSYRLKVSDIQDRLEEKIIEESL